MTCTPDAFIRTEALGATNGQGDVAAARAQGLSHRRIVLVGTSVAFIVELLVQIGFSEIVDAHLVSPTPYLFPPPVLPGALGIWVLGVGLTWLYYRASQ